MYVCSVNLDLFLSPLVILSPHFILFLRKRRGKMIRHQLYILLPKKRNGCEDSEQQEITFPLDFLPMLSLLRRDRRANITKRVNEIHSSKWSTDVLCMVIR